MHSLLLTHTCILQSISVVTSSSLVLWRALCYKLFWSLWWWPYRHVFRISKQSFTWGKWLSSSPTRHIFRMTSHANNGTQCENPGFPQAALCLDHGTSTCCYIGRVRQCLKLRKGRSFTNFLEGEYSRMWGGVCMVVILLAFLIWWDHLHPSNHFILSYIIMDFSWKRLRKVRQYWAKNSLDNVWRIPIQLMLEASICPSSFCGLSSCEFCSKCMCVLGRRTTKRELAT